MHNFFGEGAQPTTRTILGEQPMRGMHQVVIDRLRLCKKNTEVVNLMKQGKLLRKFGREAPK